MALVTAHIWDVSCTSLACLGNLWCLSKVIQSTGFFTGLGLTNTRKKSPSRTQLRLGAKHSHSLSDREIDEITAVKRTMACTLGCSVCFTLASLFTLAYISDYYQRIGMLDNQRDRDEEERALQKSRPLGYIAQIWNIAGYILMIALCFRRMMLVFDNTVYSLNDCTAKAIKWMIITLMSTIMLSFIVRIFTVRMAILVTVSSVIGYIFLSIWLSFRFLKNTRDLISDFSVGNTNPSSEQVTRDLLNISLKLTILTVTAVWSTLLLNVISVIALSLSNDLITFYLRSLFWTIDPLLNNFSMMCSLDKCDPHYRFVFGWLHQFVLSSVEPVSAEDTNDTTQV